ncbi:hypothetical protein ACP4OV_007422 [Aristida adscensionis]
MAAAVRAFPAPAVALVPSVSSAGRRVNLTKMTTTTTRTHQPLMSRRTCGSRHTVRAAKGAGDHQPRQPEPEDNNADPSDPKPKAFAKKSPEELDKFTPCAVNFGLSLEDDADMRRIVDMFHDEEFEIQENMSKLPLGYNDESSLLTIELCMAASRGVSIASGIMFVAFLRLGHRTEISVQTIEQTIRIYKDIFVKIADDTYRGKAPERNTVLSLLDALEGLAAISHILFHDAADAVNHILFEDSSTKYNPYEDVGALWSDFKQKMSSLKQNVRKASTLQLRKVATETLRDARKLHRSFVVTMMYLRKDALAQASGFTQAYEALRKIIYPLSPEVSEALKNHGHPSSPEASQASESVSHPPGPRASEAVKNSNNQPTLENNQKVSRDSGVLGLLLGMASRLFNRVSFG